MAASDTRHTVRLSGAQETLLITLYAKALDFRSRRSVLKDAKADELVRTIDYDFGKLDSFGNRTVIPLRAKQLDDWLRTFLAGYPDALVLKLGCGLDTRIARIGPGPGVRWIDIDFPEVIATRRQFFAERDAYSMVGASITDPDLLAGIPRDRPTVIAAEGVFEYLTGVDVRALLDRITSHFGRGEIVFDVMSSFAIKSGESSLQSTTGAVHQWAVDDLRMVDALNGRLKRVADVSVFETPSVKRLPWKFRLICGGMSHVQKFRDMMRLLQYRF